MIQVDPDKKVQEPKTDNFVIFPVVKVKTHAILNINTDNKKADEAIEEYLKLFVDTNTINPTVTINVGKPSSPKKGKGWSYDTNEIRSNNVYVGNLRHVGLVAKDAQGIGTDQIYVFGNQIEGTVAAVKRMVNARAIFFEGAFDKAELLDKYDTLAVSVLDLMNNPENKPFRDTKTDDFKKIVSDILNDNNFEIAIKTVKTTNDNTTLRMKNLNSDFSEKYKDAIVNSSKPVVMSGGIFSNLHTFEDGLGGELAQEGYDVWTIEMTGGPETECTTCPDYTYDDLTTYYWPALIAGVMEYSGKSKIDYVGHSNGCRAALSSLNNYSNSGKNAAGNCFNLQTGTYNIACDLPSFPVDKFFGIACPATLNDNTPFTSMTREDFILDNVNKGDYSIFMNKNILGKKHISWDEYARFLLPTTSVHKGIVIALLVSPDTISMNLMDFYNDLAINESSVFDVSNVNVSKLYLFNANPYDLILADDDGYRILNQSQVSSQNKNISILDGALRYNHAFIKSVPETKNKIKGLLQK